MLKTASEQEKSADQSGRKVTDQSEQKTEEQISAVAAGYSDTPNPEFCLMPSMGISACDYDRLSDSAEKKVIDNSRADISEYCLGKKSCLGDVSDPTSEDSLSCRRVSVHPLRLQTVEMHQRPR